MNLPENVTVISDVADSHYGGEDVPDVVLHPETEEEIAKTRYHRTDGWRGYWETDALPGWKRVGEGCHCGGYSDAPSGTSTKEVVAEIEKLAEEHEEIVLILCGGSNVFAMQYDVYARGSSG
jgi:hypothetical protein